METPELIIVDVFCRECQIEITLIEELEDFGLIELIQNNGLKYIHTNHVSQVQKIIKFHNELNINKEGIEVVLTLLERLNQQKQELKYLQEKLKLYE
jgi:hypothetical protein